MNDSLGRSLHASARRGHVAVLTELLDAGAGHNDDALWSAAVNGHVPLQPLLLSRGACVHYESDLALRLAAFHGRQEMMAFLLDNGADLHTERCRGLAECMPGVSNAGAITSAPSYVTL